MSLQLRDVATYGMHRGRSSSEIVWSAATIDERAATWGEATLSLQNLAGEPKIFPKTLLESQTAPVQKVRFNPFSIRSIVSSQSDGFDDLISKMRSSSRLALLRRFATHQADVQQLRRAVHLFDQCQAKLVESPNYLKLKHLSDLERSMSHSEGSGSAPSPKSLIKLFELEIDKLAPLMTAHHLEKVANDMTRLLECKFGDEHLQLDVSTWGYLKAFPRVPTCDGSDVSQYREMVSRKEDEFIEFLCTELRRLYEKYQGHPVVSWFFFCVRTAVNQGRYGFLANRTMVMNLHILDGADSNDLLPWTEFGNYFHFAIEGKQVDAMDLVGNDSAHYVFFRDLGAVAMPTFANKLTNLLEAYETQSSYVESLKVKILAVSVSIMITSGQLAVKYLMGAETSR